MSSFMVSNNYCIILVNLDSTSISPTLDVASNDLDNMLGGNIRVSKGVEYSKFTVIILLKEESPS